VAVVADEVLLERDLAWVERAALDRGTRREVLVQVTRRVADRWAAAARAELEEKLR
jgi:hypothetical protein